jgi:hypothetical protein
METAISQNRPRSVRALRSCAKLRNIKHDKKKTFARSTGLYADIASGNQKALNIVALARGIVAPKLKETLRSQNGSSISIYVRDLSASTDKTWRGRGEESLD